MRLNRRFKRILTALFAAAFLALCACAEKPDAAAYEALADLQAALEAQTRAALDFRMEASFRDPDTGEGGVLYEVSGETKFDTGAQTAWQRFTATRLGATGNGEEYYADGVRTHVENGQVTLLPIQAEELFCVFPYRVIPLPALSELKRLQTEESSGGELYTLVSAAGQKQLVEEIWGLDLYALAGISTPDRERESYGDVTYTWSVKDGTVRTLYVQLTVSLFEKAGYTPGYTAQDDDGRLDLTIQTRLSFGETGESVEIPAYEAG